MQQIYYIHNVVQILVQATVYPHNRNFVRVQTWGPTQDRHLWYRMAQDKMPSTKMP